MGGFWKDAVGVLPFVGPIAAGAIERGQNRRAIERQNEYNKPINQLARLREAGLPFAAFSDTAAGNQSQPQESTSPGIGEGIQAYASNLMLKKQIELIEAQIRTEKARGEREWVNAFRDTIKRDLEHDMFQYDSAITSDDLNPIGQVSNQVRKEVRTRNYQETQRKLEMHREEIARIESMVKDTLHKDGTLVGTARKQLEELINKVTLGDMDINRGSIMDNLINRMKESGGELSLIEALFHSIIMGRLSPNAR